MTRASAPGKMLLLGEYAVLEGAPCLVMGAERRAEVEVAASPDDSHHLDAQEMGLADCTFRVDAEGKPAGPDIDQGTAEKLKVVAAMLHQVGVTEPRSITVRSASFQHRPGVKLGLGSSAAVATALAGALSPDATVKDLFFHALHGHRLAQGGVGSGADVAASTYGGLLSYTRDEVPTQLPLPDELQLIPVFVGHSASTTSMVGRVKRFKQSSPSDYDAIMTRLRLVSSGGIAGLSEGRAPVVVSAFREYALALEELGRLAGVEIMSEVHMKAKAAAEEAGVAYKSSGAGGGDLGVAVTDSPDAASAARQSLSDAGFEVLNLDVAFTGLRIESND